MKSQFDVLHAVYDISNWQQVHLSVVKFYKKTRSKSVHQTYLLYSKFCSLASPDQQHEKESPSTLFFGSAVCRNRRSQRHSLVFRKPTLAQTALVCHLWTNCVHSQQRSSMLYQLNSAAARISAFQLQQLLHSLLDKFDQCQQNTPTSSS